MELINDQDLDRILAILENPIRRKILKKLSQEMNYPLQLSRELNVSQQAIMKHLKVLEDGNFVISYEEKSDKGGPPKKVYTPKKRYCIRIDLGPNTYNEEIYSFSGYEIKRTGTKKEKHLSETKVEIGGKVTGEMKNKIEGALPAFADSTLESLRMDLEKAISEDGNEKKLGQLKSIIGHLNKELNEQELRRRKLLSLRERAFEEVNSVIRSMLDDDLEKDIMSLYVKKGLVDVDTISELLDRRKTHVDKALKIVIKRVKK